MNNTRLFPNLLIAVVLLIPTSCSGQSNNEKSSTDQEPIILENTHGFESHVEIGTTDSTQQTKQSNSPNESVITDSYEDALFEAESLAEEDRITGHPGHHIDDYGDSDGDDEEYDEGWEDGYNF